MVRTRARADLVDDLEEKAQQGLQLKSVADSPLFRLPPELRNMIYRYAIVSNRTLRVKKAHGIPEATLFLVSKLVRGETYGLFYAENKFKCVVRNYDPAPLKLVHRKLSRVSVKLVRHVCTELQCSGTADWENLVAWLHCAHQGFCCGFSSDRVDDPESSLVSGLFKVALNGPRITLKALDFLLESMRPTLVNINRDWGKD